MTVCREILPFDYMRLNADPFQKQLATLKLQGANKALIVMDLTVEVDLQVLDGILAIAKKGHVSILFSNGMIPKGIHSTFNDKIQPSMLKFMEEVYTLSKKSTRIRLKSLPSFNANLFIVSNKMFSRLLISPRENDSLNGHVDNAEKRGYNLYVENENHEMLISQHVHYFEYLFENIGEPVSIEMMGGFSNLRKKKLFNIKTKRTMHERGETLKKEPFQMQSEIMLDLFLQSGIKMGDVEIYETTTSNEVLNLAMHLYEKLKRDGVLENDTVEYSFKEESLNEMAKTIFRRSQLTPYFFELNEELLPESMTLKDNSRHLLLNSTPLVLLKASIMRDLIHLFKIYYDEYYNGKQPKEEMTVRRKKKAQEVLDIFNEDDFFEPQKMEKYKFDHILRNLKSMTSEDDSWIFQYQQHDIKSLKERFYSEMSGAYLAHETGMGKSIIIGKFIKDIMKENRNIKVLLVCPSSLQKQWVEDVFQESFDMSARIIDKPIIDQYGEKIWEHRMVNVISVDYLRNLLADGNRNLKSTEIDILIIDESHLLKNENSQRFQNIKELNAKFTVLASATPIQNSLKEFLVQMSLIDKTVDIKKENLRYVEEIKNTYLIRRTREKDMVEFSNEEMTARNVIPVQINPSEEFKQIYDILENDLRGGRMHYYNVLGKINSSSEVLFSKIKNRMSFMYLQQVTSSVSALVAGMNNLKENILLLADNKHERQQVGEEEDLDGSEEMDDWYTLRKSRKMITPQDREKLMGDIDLIDSYMKRFLTEDGKPIMNTKEEKLLSLLNSPAYKGKQVIVFVKYLTTGEHLKTLLKERGHRVDFYNGKLVKEKKHEMLMKFKRNQIDVMICTDAANAGLNLQFCNVVVNYDLNWNPMIVEQRIGRVHRIGQRSKEVTVLNLILNETIDSRIATKMNEKIELFDTLFFSSNEILGKIGEAYMGVEDFSQLEIPDEAFIFPEKKEEFRNLLEGTNEDGSLLKSEHILLEEYKRKLLMHILGEFGMKVRDDNEKEYYVRYGEKTYLVALNDVFAILEDLEGFFPDMTMESDFKITAVKEDETIKDGMTLHVDTLNVEICLEYLIDMNIPEDIFNQIEQRMLRLKGMDTVAFHVNKVKRGERGTGFVETGLVLGIDGEYSPIIDDVLYKYISLCPVNDYRSETVGKDVSLEELSALYELTQNILMAEEGDVDRITINELQAISFR